MKKQTSELVNKERAALYLTALMELHAFHLKTIFTDYIITL